MGSVLLVLPGPHLWALCEVPKPRLVCAEATHSRTVVIARLTRKKVLTSNEDADLNVYTLHSVKVLRGMVPQKLIVHEANDSGRASFDWQTGQSYLLFLIRPPNEGAWVIDGCGNSGPILQSSRVIAELTDESRLREKPLIAGTVMDDSWVTGLAQVSIEAVGQAGSFHAETDREGHFEMHVPPGRYAVTAKTGNVVASANPFSYENPDHLELKLGTCAQVSFSTRPADH